jgi:3-methylcrotonyl-CoA carboxylase alpha subunit
MVRAEFVGTDGLLIEADGKRHYVTFVRDGDTFLLDIAGETYGLTREQPTSGGANISTTASPDIVAPMPGKVIQVIVQAGDHVTSGDTLMVLEAMKMETRLLAEAAGIVEAVHVKGGDLVNGGQVLAVMRYDQEGDNN